MGLEKLIRHNSDLHKWTWRIDHSGKQYLISELLEDAGFKHGFFTLDWISTSLNEMALILGKGLSIHNINQVHGNKIIIASESKIKGKKANADALISDQTCQSLWIYSADCIPLLLADNCSGKVVACHAGWRGISSGIVETSLKKLKSNGGSNSSIMASIGPSISAKNYPVHYDVAQQIIAAHKAKRMSKENNLSEENAYRKNVFEHHENNRTNKIYVDIKLEAVRRLINGGLGKNQISICQICTYDNPQVFASRRRENRKIFQWSGIAAKN